MGRRVNGKLFDEAEMGAAVRVGGRFSPGSAESGERSLTTTDGASLTVLVEVEGVRGLVLPVGGFVEVDGVKEEGRRVRAKAVSSLPATEVDMELWEEAIKLAALPQLQHLFTPMTAAA